MKKLLFILPFLAILAFAAVADSTNIATAKTLTWHDPNPTNAVLGYCIYQGQYQAGNLTWTKVAFVPTNSYTVTVTPGTWALYCVTVTNWCGESPLSASAGGWVPLAADTLTIK